MWTAGGQCAAATYSGVNVFPGWETLRKESEDFRAANYAPATIRTRELQVNTYLEFCAEVRGWASPVPCPPPQTCAYMAYLARRMRYSSIRQYLSALSYFLKEAGVAPIDYMDHRIKTCLQGIRRTLGDGKRQPEPLLPKQLLAMLAFTSDTPGHTVFKAALLCSFRALLRKCHVTESDSMLLRSDFTFTPWGMVIAIRRSKTIQYGERVLRVPVTKVANRNLCAVHWIRKHFDECATPPGGPAFRMRRDGVLVPFPYPIYQGTIKLLCRKAGLEESAFSSHSLRRGGATFLRICGASIRDIKERGDWKSDAVYEYLRTSLEERVTQDFRVAAVLSDS